MGLRQDLDERRGQRHQPHHQAAPLLQTADGDAAGRVQVCAGEGQRFGYPAPGIGQHETERAHGRRLRRAGRDEPLPFGRGEIFPLAAVGMKAPPAECPAPGLGRWGGGVNGFPHSVQGGGSAGLRSLRSFLIVVVGNVQVKTT